MEIVVVIVICLSLQQLFSCDDGKWWLGGKPTTPSINLHGRLPIGRPKIPSKCRFSLASLNLLPESMALTRIKQKPLHRFWLIYIIALLSYVTFSLDHIWIYFSLGDIIFIIHDDCEGHRLRRLQCQWRRTLSLLVRRLLCRKIFPSLINDDGLCAVAAGNGHGHHSPFGWQSFDDLKQTTLKYHSYLCSTWYYQMWLATRALSNVLCFF